MATRATKAGAPSSKATPACAASLPSNRVAPGMPCTICKRNWPRSRSRATLPKARNTINRGVSTCSTKAGVSWPKRSNTDDWPASLKLALFWRCPSRNSVLPVNGSTPKSKKASGLSGRNT